MTSKFAFSNSLAMLCHQLRLNWTEIASQVSASHNSLQNRSISDGRRSLQYDQWTAVERRYEGDDFAIKAAEIFAATPSHPAALACLCSPNLDVALERVARVLPDAGLRIEKTDSNVAIGIDTNTADLMPASLQVATLAYVFAVTRLVTRTTLSPERLTLPADYAGLDSVAAFFGVMPEVGAPALHVDAEALSLDFCTFDTEIWSAFEMRLNRASGSERHDINPYAEQVQEVLFALLPIGCSTIEHVSDRLAVSKRTLQRKLSAEGLTFQKLLHKTRKQLAHFYLSVGQLTVPQIAGLLSYRDPHSFLRAYRGWTGKSPVRAEPV